jgi:hypothetical protein
LQLTRTYLLQLDCANIGAISDPLATHSHILIATALEKEVDALVQLATHSHIRKATLSIFVNLFGLCCLQLTRTYVLQRDYYGYDYVIMDLATHSHIRIATKTLSSAINDFRLATHSHIRIATVGTYKPATPTVLTP